MINRVVLVGRLTKDPELKNTSGKPVCTFFVAVDNRGKNAEGAKTTSFIPCVAFAQTADAMSKFARKGMLVGVEGRLNQRSYVTQEGKKSSILEVLCDSVQFLEPKQQVENEEPEVPPYDDEAASDENKNLDNIDLPNNDLPF